MDRTYKTALCALLVAALCFGLVPAPVAAVQYSGSSSYMEGKYYTALTQVPLTGDPRVDIVNVARSQVGYQEGSSPYQLSGEIYGGINFTEYGSWYGMQDMWCAMFVSWCASRVGISPNVVPSHSYTPEGLNWFAGRGLAYSRQDIVNRKYTPQPGDLIYFKSSRNAKPTNHVGIVTGYANNRIYTIEGNVGGPGMTTNGGMVVERSYPITNTFIVYVCDPNYEIGSTRVLENAEALEQQSQLQSLRQALQELECGDDTGYGRVTVTAKGAVCLGIGQWYGSQATALLKELGAQQLPDLSKELTVGEQAYLRSLLTSEAGIALQNQWMEASLAAALEQGAREGITHPDALLLYAAVDQLAGSATARSLVREASDLTPQGLMNVIKQLYPHLVRSCEMLIA